MRKLVFLLVLVAMPSFSAWATHIRAGEISVRRLSCTGLEFLITFTGYEDTESQIQLGQGTIFFGDGSSITLDETQFEITDSIVAPRVRMRRFNLLHTYEASGTYIIRFQEQNRNDGVLNMTNSVGTPFYVETVITIDPFLGCNNTPIFLVPPIDRGARGVLFMHNPGAYDPDGDSLAFMLEVNKKDVNTPVDNYQFPNDYDANTFGDLATTEAGATPPTYSIDPATGDLVWDAPYGEGEYNVAFSVREYRNIDGRWYLLGYVVRDMQIIVEATDNEPPELEIPPDTCVEAGTVLSAEFLGTDPDGDRVMISAFGGIFENTFPSPARVSPNPPRFQSVPAITTFNWNTICDHVQERPYEVQVRIQDDAGFNDVSLSRFKTWRIQVVAPAPQGVAADVQGRSVELNWDNYECSNAFRMQVYRRVDSYDFDATGCNVGIPDEAGYELVRELPIGQTQFLDTDGGEGLAPGATYCYRLVAIFGEPRGGESYASEEVCVKIEALAPVITEVSVVTTDASNGEIDLTWLPPFDRDTVAFSYEVYRSTGMSGMGNRTLVTTTADTTLRDTGLDTENSPYHYEVVVFDENGIVLDTSAEASSVNNTPVPQLQAIEVLWDADVPWSNNTQEYPLHYIYRNRTDAFAEDQANFDLIDSVDVNVAGFRYLDDGSFNGIAMDDTKEYCYFVATQGSYGTDSIAYLDPLINRSQIQCAQPNDTVAPCPVVDLFVGNLDGSEACESILANESCSFNDFSNFLEWSYSTEPDCMDELAGFNIYYSRTGEPDTYELLAYTEEAEFLHDNLSSFAGCYRVSVVDRSGNESELSAPYCRENCPQYVLPNIFTVNGDDVNETFVALGDRYFQTTGDNQCPRFVEEVHLKVFNRWGIMVYEYNTENQVGTERSIYINWDGRSSNGAILPEGTYFYRVDVTFTTLNPIQTVQTKKGTVYISRTSP